MNVREIVRNVDVKGIFFISHTHSLSLSAAKAKRCRTIQLEKEFAPNCAVQVAAGEVWIGGYASIIVYDNIGVTQVSRWKK